MKQVEKIEEWAALSKVLKEKGYRLWQMQFSWDMPEGFHAWFWRAGIEKDYEVLTHSRLVQDTIIDYK